jgi:hypothetical protein
LARTKTFTGRGISIDELGCEPLNSLVGLELCAQFMQMFDVRLSNGHTARAFKHRTTRGYLHLDLTEPGLAYWYGDGRSYHLVDLTTALIAVFRDVWTLGSEDEAAQTWQLLNLALDRLETPEADEQHDMKTSPRATTRVA